MRDFQGESQLFNLLLTLSAFAGMLTGLACLLVYGWAVVWWAPVLIFLISVVAGTTVGVILDKDDSLEKIWEAFSQYVEYVNQMHGIPLERFISSPDDPRLLRRMSCQTARTVRNTLSV